MMSLLLDRRRRTVAIAVTFLTVLALTVGLFPMDSARADAVVPTSQAPAATMVEATGPVKAADLSRFRPGNIVSDAVFFDRNTMTEAQIQAFLEQKVPRCESGYTCLKDWYDASRTTSADAMCGAYSGGTRERASRIIYKVAQACGINPQVILVTLQKEQGLVTHVWPSEWRYTAAMGQGCPDTAACDSRYYGFFNQVYGAAWQLKRYANPPGTSQYFTWYAPGKTWNILYNPNRNCGSSAVYVENQATSNLYYYTPYQPNAASLRAGYGQGDGCSSYGNRNFFQYFTDWFGSTQYVATDTPFVDVSTQASSPVYNGFASDIVWLSSMGISTGWELPYGGREFRPAVAVTRDVMATFLYRLAGEPAFTPPARSPFADVPTDHVFYKEISWLANTGVSTGWQNGAVWEFRPAEAVTRDVMAAFLYRFSGSPSFVAPTTSPFIDVPTAQTFYKEVAWMSATRISGGWATGAGAEYRPGADVSRDVMAAFVRRADTYLNPFVDVSTRPGGTQNVFAKDIAWLSFAGVSGGWARADGTREYRPSAPVTRDVMATFLYRLAGQPAFTAPAVSPFSDVPTTHVFYREIAWLASTGISVGWQNGVSTEFQPSAPVTRDVMAAFLYRFAGEPELTAGTASAFIDVPADHVFAREIAWMAATKISIGWGLPDGTSEYRPDVPVTRDVMSAFLHRLRAYLLVSPASP
jgi:hypothetical protein